MGDCAQCDRDNRRDRVTARWSQRGDAEQVRWPRSEAEEGARDEVTAPAQITRKAIAMPLAVVVLALAPTGAWGVADVIKSTNDNEFDRATYHSDEGDRVRFQHTGGRPHDVTSTPVSGDREAVQ